MRVVPWGRPPAMAFCALCRTWRGRRRGLCPLRTLSFLLPLLPLRLSFALCRLLLPQFRQLVALFLMLGPRLSTGLGGEPGSRPLTACLPRVRCLGDRGVGVRGRDCLGWSMWTWMCSPDRVRDLEGDLDLRWCRRREGDLDRELERLLYWRGRAGVGLMLRRGLLRVDLDGLRW